MSQAVIRGCAFEQGGLVIEYSEPAEDVRANGLQKSHVMFMPPEDAFEDLIEMVTVSLQRALRVALAEFEEAPPAEPVEQPEEPSLYDNPEDRT